MFDSIQQFFMTYPGDRAGIAQNLWLIVALPALGALICGVFGKALGRANTGLVATGAVAGSFLLSLLAFWAVNDVNTKFLSAFAQTVQSYTLGHDYGTWFGAGDFQIHYGMLVDHLSGTLMLVITGVGLLIHVYSTSYMSHDAGYWRYFAYLNLFVAMMLVLVLADNLVLLFIGWEGVGFCSYLLIGFWYQDEEKAFAGRKAFITNRIGDFAFLIATFLLVMVVGAFSAQATPANFDGRPDRYAKWQQGLEQTGALNFSGLEQMARTLSPSAEKTPFTKVGSVNLETEIQDGPLAGFSFGGVLTAILLLFLLGAAGKSAQIPLYVWLPDAMAGPTPVSALIHAATMVTAGVYLFCRMSYLVVLSPTAMAAIAIIGALTALLAALIAFAQDDIKKVLAYSTVSQLGFMFMAVGMGVFWAAVLHLVTHAFFKACLFLGAGSVMHGNAEETDIKKLGGLRKEMKWTWATFAIATLAITGIVPLSGFFSKDAILHGVHGTHLEGLGWVTNFVWIIGLVTALCTAFYMARLYLLTFEGKRSEKARIPHAHESDGAMVFPLVVLAGLSIVAILYGVPLMRAGSGPLQPVMENFLSPVFATANATITKVTDSGARSAGYGLVEQHVEAGYGGLVSAWVMAWVIALIGGAIAAFLYLRVFPAREGQPSPAWARSFRKLATNKFYVDELYGAVVIRPLRAISIGLHRIVDELVIDTLLVRGTAWVTARTGSVLRYLQTGDAQSYAAVMALALLAGVAFVVFQVLR